MKYSTLKKKMSLPVFFDYQARRLFPDEAESLVHVQLSRMAQRGDLLRLKRGLFAFPDRQVDQHFLAQWLYRPSYLSLETALHYYGMIPEEVFSITSVTPTTTKTIRTQNGTYLYSKIRRELYFGYQFIRDAHSQLYYPLAYPEKALLDYIYIRRINRFEEDRLDLSGVDRSRLEQYARHYPAWVKRAFDE